MFIDSSTAGTESPAFGPEDWDASHKKGSYKKFLEANKESIPHKEPVSFAARRTVDKLQLALKIPSDEAQKIVGKYMDELAATMNERLAEEGKEVREKYIALINDPVRGRTAMEKRLDTLTGFTPNDQKALATIVGHFTILEKGEKGKSYLTRWMNRDATNGNLAQEDYPVFQRIAKNAPKGSPEEKFLTNLHENLRDLRRMDPYNLTFIRSTPTMNPGGKFIVSLLLGGIALFSLLMARKSGKLPKKGLVALGLLYYIHRNPDSKLSFLSSSRYETLTKELRGSKEGTAVIDALGDKKSRTALRDFAKREHQRQHLNPAQRSGLLSSEDSMKDLVAALRLGGKSESKLRSMQVNDILELSTTLQKFSREELSITGEFVATGSTKEDIAKIDLAEPKKT